MSFLQISLSANIFSISPRQRGTDALWYLGLSTSHQCAHEGDVAPGCDVAIGARRLWGGGFGAGGGLSRQTGLIHGQVRGLRGEGE